jgi:hypothetical protein
MRAVLKILSVLVKTIIAVKSKIIIGAKSTWFAKQLNISRSFGRIENSKHFTHLLYFIPLSEFLLPPCVVLSYCLTPPFFQLAMYLFDRIGDKLIEDQSAQIFSGMSHIAALDLSQ